MAQRANRLRQRELTLLCQTESFLTLPSSVTSSTVSRVYFFAANKAELKNVFTTFVSEQGPFIILSFTRSKAGINFLPGLFANFLEFAPCPEHALVSTSDQITTLSDCNECWKARQ